MNKSKKLNLFFSFVFVLYFGDNLVAQTAGNGVTDVDGNFYPSVIIGNQEWTTTNLQTGRFKNFDIVLPVPYADTYNSTWTSSSLNQQSMCCLYNDASSVSTDDRGILYNWYAVNDPRGLAPEGWHIPSQTEWQTLIDFTNSNVQDVMRKPGIENWGCNDIANNQYNFSAIGSGLRISAFNNPSDGQYQSADYASFFWSSTTLADANTVPDAGTAYAAFSHCFNNSFPVLLANTGFGKEAGMSVRCIKNEQLSNNSFNKIKLSINPNPIKNTFTINTNENIYNIEIFNLLGGSVFVSKNSTKIINIENLQSGIYILKVSFENDNKNYKIIKE